MSGPDSRPWYSAAQRVFGAAPADVAGIVGAPAATGGNRRHQHEARRIGDAVIGAGDGDLAGLQRLAQRIEHLRGELGQLIEEQHAVMAQRNLTRPRPQTAADQRGHGSGMMRGTKRPAVGQRAAFNFPCDGSDHRHFQELGWRQRRQDRRQSRCQHRLAGAGRADHQQVVSTGGGDFERALGALLTLDVGEIERACRRARGSSAAAG